MPERILVAAGGTVGHVAPALAVADRLRAAGVDVVFAGTPDRIEAELVPQRGYPFESFRVSGIPRRPSVAGVRSLGRTARAPWACAEILRRVRPDVVFGGGGYVAGPMVAAARRLGIPSALSEADARLGLANRLAAPFADRVFLAFPIAGRTPPKYLVTGRPVDPAFVTTTRAEGRAAFDLPSDELVVVVVGGSLGAGPINDAVHAAYADGVPVGVRIVLITGRGKTRGSVDPRLQEIEFCDRMPALVAAADLVVCRSGGSVAEVAAAGCPAVLIPWAGAADDHQTLNAQPFRAVGAAEVISDRDLDGPLLRATIDRLLADPHVRSGMAEAMRSAGRPGAAQSIADELRALRRR